MYSRLGPITEVDAAAVQPVLVAGAGTANQPDTGESVRCNKENLLNPSFACVSSEPFGEIHLARS